jgi:glycogen(starch) synthase
MPASYGVTGKNLARSLAVAHVVRSLVRSEGVQLVESPIWDAEGYATVLAREVPLVLRLNTPMALAAEMQGWPSNPDLRLAAELEWSLLRGADAVIDPSGSIVETIRKRYDVTPRAADVVSLPFGTTLPPDAPKPNEGGIRFLFLGRFEPRKGIDTLLAAIPSVLHAVPDASFDLAGSIPSPDSRRSILESLPPAVQSRVRIHGEVDDATRTSLYRGADLFVAPSRYESFGIVYIEAMAHGCACVAGESGGPSAIVRSGRTGVLVPPGDVDALAAALIDLARQPDRVREMGRAARRYVEENHSMEAMVDRTIDVYEAALTRWRGAYAEAAGR